MTNLLAIKPYIHDFVKSNLDGSFTDVYWLGELKNVPSYPYCMLSVIAENKDKRTSHHEGEFSIINSSGSSGGIPAREKITTRYKTATITIGVYNAFIEDTAEEDEDKKTAKEFAYEQIDFLEGEFEDYPVNNLFSIQNISPIRPLHETVDGGYMYRYEFDLTIGYNEAHIKEKATGGGVDVSLVDTNEVDTTIHNGSVYIDGEDAIKNDLDKDYYKDQFMIEIDSNDNIVVEIT